MNVARLTLPNVAYPMPNRPFIIRNIILHIEFQLLTGMMGICRSQRGIENPHAKLR